MNCVTLVAETPIKRAASAIEHRSDVVAMPPSYNKPCEKESYTLARLSGIIGVERRPGQRERSKVSGGTCERSAVSASGSSAASAYHSPVRPGRRPRHGRGRLAPIFSSATGRTAALRQCELLGPAGRAARARRAAMVRWGCTAAVRCADAIATLRGTLGHDSEAARALDVLDRLVSEGAAGDPSTPGK